MASGLMRWPALAGLLAVGAAAIAYRAAPPRREEPGISTERQRLSGELTQVRREIIDAEVASGIRERAAALAPSRDGVHLVAIDSAGRLGLLDPADAAMFRRAWSHLSRTDSAVTMTVVAGQVIYPDRIIHPPAGRAGGCLAWVWNWTRWDENQAAAAIGPCSYYAEFGAPGPAVGAWFASTAVGQISRPAQSNQGDTMWPIWIAPQELREGVDPSGWNFRLFRQSIPPYLASPDAAACAAAASPRCAAALLRSLDQSPEPPYWSYWDYGRGMAGFERALLPRMLAEFGTARFGAFWHSTAPVPAAFERAFGLPLDQWLHGELADYLGPLEVGAGDLKGASMSVLVWVVLLGFVTAGLARKLKY